MHIAIIGAGFTGLTAATVLQKKGHTVTIIEKGSLPGGLAVGYKEKEWNWTLEAYYHHWFTNDAHIVSLAKAIGHPLVKVRPKTSIYVENVIYQLDSPMKVLTFPKLTFGDRIRMAAVLGLLKYNPFWKPLEKIHADSFLRKTMGERAYKMIWEPQFSNKFGKKHSKTISLAWFWARIRKRTPALYYPEGGFLSFAKHLEKNITDSKGTFLYNTTIQKITQTKDKKIVVKTDRVDEKKFDKIIVTLPLSIFLSITPQLPQMYKKKFAHRNSLGAVNLVLRLKKPFFSDNTYWLSVCDQSAPVMAIVEHTNFMNKKNYHNETILYLGNYLDPADKQFTMTDKELLNFFDPLLKKINPDYKKNIIGIKLFKTPFAQPIIPVNYSKLIPDTQTPLEQVILANMEQVYPWDRGTNYAVELGEKAAEYI